MNNNEKRPPTWVKTDSSGSQFISYDDDLSTFQLQTLDKIVENIELCYDYNRAKQGANTNNDYAEMSESYMYKKAKDPIGRWSWRDSTDRTYYKLPSRISSSFRLNNDNYEQRYQQQKLIQVNKPQDDIPQQGSYLYNCFSKETSGQVRAYLNKLYLDLVEKTDKPWSAKPVEVAKVDEEEEEEEEESETSQTNVTDIKPEKEKPKAKSPFPKIVPLTSEQKPRSIMKNTNNRMSSKYEQKLFDVYSNLTKEKMKQKQKQEDGFDTDHSLNDDVFHPSTSSGIASTSSNPNESIISTKLLKEQPDHQRASIASIASSSRMVNNDDTDLDQDESGTLTPPIGKKPILSSGSMKAVTGFVSEKPEPKKLVQAAPLEPTRDIYSRKTVQIPTRDMKARDESSNYFQFPPVNQQKQQQTPKQQQQRKAAPSKLGRLSENADRIVENINNRFQPSKTQLGRIKDVSEPPESKIKFLSNFSSKFIEKANKIQHKR